MTKVIYWGYNTIMDIPDIKLLALDVDGILTDGKIILDNDGRELKAFCAHDGMGIKAALKAGLHIAIITSRSSHAVVLRASELGIKEIHLGVDKKMSVIYELAEKYNISPQHICYMGDDLIDLCALANVGWGVTVPQACDEVQKAAQYVTTRACGQGAVREVIELILKHNGSWERLIEYYLENGKK